MKTKICKYPSCNMTVYDPDCKYCTKHKEYEKATKQDHKILVFGYNKAIKEPYAGYISPNIALYNSVRWRKLRQEVIKDHPYCAICNTKDDLTVDHITPPCGDPTLFYEKENLQVLCRFHQNHKTQEEGVAKRRRKKLQ